MISLQPFLARIRKNMLTLLVSSGLATLLTFGTVALNSRALGAEGLGIVTLLQGYIGLVAGLFSIGTQQPIIRLGSDYWRDGQAERISSLIMLGIVVDIAAATIAGAVAVTVLVFFFPGDSVYADLTPFVMIYALTAFFSGIGTMIGVLRLFDQFYLIGLITIGHAALNLAGSAAFFLLQVDIENYIIFFATTLLLSHLAHFGFGLGVLRSNGIFLKLALLVTIEKPAVQELFSYAWTTWSTSTLNTIRNRLDIVLLGIFGGVTAVGIYGVARQLTGMLNKLSNAATSAVFPEVARLATSADDELARILWRRLAWIGLGAGLLVTLLIHFVGPVILRLGFGADFEQGSMALTLLFFSASVMLSASTFGGFIQAFVSPRMLLAVYVASTVAFLAGSTLIVLDWGLLGAALAQVAFSVSLFLLSVLVLQRRFRR